MEFRELDEKYLNEAVKLASAAYKEEKSNVEEIDTKDYEETLYNDIKELFSNKIGTLLFDKDELIGYLAFCHSLIKAKMKELKAPLAGEMSGHIFFADRNSGRRRPLRRGAPVPHPRPREIHAGGVPRRAATGRQHARAALRFPRRANGP